MSNQFTDKDYKQKFNIPIDSLGISPNIQIEPAEHHKNSVSNIYDLVRPLRNRNSIKFNRLSMDFDSLNQVNKNQVLEESFPKIDKLNVEQSIQTDFPIKSRFEKGI